MEISERFRGYLPVVVDLETGGFSKESNPVLEIACTFLTMNEDELSVKRHARWDVNPFPDSIIDPASLKVTKIDLDDPDRNGIDEKDALTEFFREVREEMKVSGCHRAVMVAHNASFDQGFINMACERTNLKRNPFHPFTALDTATLGALAFGHTVLREACRRAGIDFSEAKAHNAAYDAERTALLFCHIVNAWDYQTAWLDSARDSDGD
ncbi:MAG: ribonuclease T [Pseudomonadales bacterium]|jgi:ribonuclease T|nr:ribonuclease T [Pseudomonadales bacterium]